MNKINLKIFFAAIVCVFPLSNSADAQKRPEPTITKEVGYSKTPDKVLEKAVGKWKDAEADDEVRYHFNKVDLNGDGKLDAVVFASGDSICGTGGCRMLIFKSAGNDFELVTDMAVSRPPLVVLSTKTKGWNDLVLFVSGGGAKPYYSLLKFDGKSYPENPTVEPEIPKRKKVKGIEFLSGIELYDTGFLLK